MVFANGYNLHQTESTLNFKPINHHLLTIIFYEQFAHIIHIMLQFDLDLQR